VSLEKYKNIGKIRYSVQTEDIVGRWKEHFEELLNPTSISSVEGRWSLKTHPYPW